MMLQRLISEAAKLPDLSTEVHNAYAEFNAIGEELGYKEIEIMTKLHVKRYTCETATQRKVNLKSIETNFAKAKHAVVESEEEDFV
jgi:hypothetical protein